MDSAEVPIAPQHEVIQEHPKDLAGMRNEFMNTEFGSPTEVARGVLSLNNETLGRENLSREVLARELAKNYNLAMIKALGTDPQAGDEGLKFIKAGVFESQQLAVASRPDKISESETPSQPDNATPPANTGMYL